MCYPLRDELGPSPMIERLLAYAAIGWDFDGTLIDHPKSPLIHEFIRRHPAKKHIIVTFRTHGLQRQMYREMRDRYPDAPNLDCFHDMLNIADRAWIEFTAAAEQRLKGFNGPLTKAERYYVEWKAMVCHRLGVPVLVDDRRDQVLPGCTKYNVAYMHPDDL
jgi:hypothetical protein